ncbi:hypothetical protein [Pseudoduganella aquatica]|uniref:hypothetical protein n=1 Tax=Pseudoduganella aquatica TaxID=2660641 RepID=UPI001651E804|nr:hypothetical protein [Pseudoduganella aquatica]
MTRRAALLLTACLAASPAFGAAARTGSAAAGKSAAAGATAKAPRAFVFSAIGHAFKAGADEALLKRAITEASQDKPVFIVATGIKAAGEPCSDKLYAQRKEVLDESPRPIIVSPAGTDWTACRNSAGRSNAIERLNRIREVFYPSNESLGLQPLVLTRLSATAKFRSYAENAYWEHGPVLFATLNLPAQNNHFLQEAGRNSEFEDRLVANRAWLHRLFALAQRRGVEGIVLFSDGDPGAHVEESFSLLGGFSEKQDGYTQVRKQLRALAEKFKGKVLLVDNQGDAKTPPAMTWRGNLGHLGLGVEWETVRVQPGSANLFSLGEEAAP